jgi:DNA topoisomerase I
MSKAKAKRLVIVESPGKVKKLQTFLGREFRVLASMGHVRDLPAAELGIDIAANFKPTWEAVKGKAPLIKRLSKAMQEAEAIYLATDPDREGEAIAAHILGLTSLPPDKPVMRVAFTAITREAVRQAIEHPRPLDMQLVAAQHARRKLDRLVGYSVSPVACHVLEGRYSAGRVQSPALRLIVERERAIQAFTPETYYTLDALLDAGDTTFTAKLTALKDREMPLKEAAFLKALLGALQGAVYWVKAIQTETLQRKPPAPFTTSRLQQAASSTLSLSPERTMQLAQTLYEAGLITYMRTDAVFIAPEAQSATFDFIGRTYGEKYLPVEKPQYQSSPGAQEAHEAIRPTDVKLTPDHIKEAAGEGAALYGLIWRRFVASQMAAAQDSIQTVTIQAGKQIGQPFPLTFEARSVNQVFDGFRRVYQAPTEAEVEEASLKEALAVAEGQTLTLQKLLPQRKQTQPPSRFTEAQLIGELEKRGIGRPSTYAAILSILKARAYVQLDKRHLVPTESGCKLNDYLQRSFASVFADDYTARMETALDDIAAGKLDELAALGAFWTEFQPLLKGALSELPTASARTQLQRIGEICPKCGADLVYRSSAKGKFVGCSAYPKCRYTVGEAAQHTPLLIQPVEV